MLHDDDDDDERHEFNAMRSFHMFYFSMLYAHSLCNIVHRISLALQTEKKYEITSDITIQSRRIKVAFKHGRFINRAKEDSR